MGNGAGEDSIMEKHRKAHSVMEAMLKEREELLGHHESRVVQLKKDFERKLAVLEHRERKLEESERALKASVKSDSAILKKNRQLESRLNKLTKEEAAVRAYLAKARQEVELLHGKEARKRAESASLERKLARLKLEFDTAYREVDRITTSLRMREAELKKLNRAMEEAAARHSTIKSEITHHSLSEIRIAIKRAEEHLSSGLFTKAKSEYDQIRKFYSYLPREDKKKIYSSIERIKGRLAVRFPSR